MEAAEPAGADEEDEETAEKGRAPRVDEEEAAAAAEKLAAAAAPDALEADMLMCVWSWGCGEWSGLGRCGRICERESNDRSAGEPSVCNWLSASQQAQVHCKLLIRRPPLPAAVMACCHRPRLHGPSRGSARSLRWLRSSSLLAIHPSAQHPTFSKHPFESHTPHCQSALPWLRRVEAQRKKKKHTGGEIPRAQSRVVVRYFSASLSVFGSIASSPCVLGGLGGCACVG